MKKKQETSTKTVHTAVYISTESGDQYLHCYDQILDEKQAKKLIKQTMGEEADYICQMSLVYTGESRQI